MVQFLFFLFCFRFSFYPSRPSLCVCTYICASRKHLAVFILHSNYLPLPICLQPAFLHQQFCLENIHTLIPLLALAAKWPQPGCTSVARSPGFRLTQGLACTPTGGLLFHQWEFLGVSAGASVSTFVDLWPKCRSCEWASSQLRGSDARAQCCQAPLSLGGQPALSIRAVTVQPFACPLNTPFSRPGKAQCQLGKAFGTGSSLPVVRQYSSRQVLCCPRVRISLGWGWGAVLPVLLFWFKVLNLFLSNITHWFSVALLCKDLSNTSSVTFAFLAVGLNLLPRISK